VSDHNAPPTPATDAQTPPDRKRKHRRKKRSPIDFSTFAALLFCALVAAWMYSGKVVIGGSDHDKLPPISEQTAADGAGEHGQQAARLFRVETRVFHAVRRRRLLKLRARTEADANVEIRAETAGRVVRIGGNKGRLAKKDEILCQLDMGTRKATLTGARAQLRQTRADYQAAKKLAHRGYSADLSVSAKLAAYEKAAAARERAELDLANTSIKAPFAGVVETQPAKVGDYLTVGAICARLVKLHPLLVIGDVSERDIGQLKLGQKGEARLVTGETVRGHIRFISPTAATATRTFRIELAVSNKNRAIRDGVTADISLSLPAVRGHFLSPGILTLNDAGEVGVRTVDKDSVVRFRAVEILDQTRKGVWVTGLPKETRIITVGQDFVIDGQKVEAVTQPPGGGETDAEKADAEAKAGSESGQQGSAANERS